MAALGARLFIIIENSANKKIVAYNFDTAAWEDVFSTNDAIGTTSGVCWDGAYHLWWSHDVDYFKRLNLYDHSVSSFLSTLPNIGATHNYYNHNYNGLIYACTDNVAGYFQKFKHGAGVWAVEASPGNDGVAITIPLSAANKPGNTFWAQGNAVGFKEWDPVAGTWTARTNAPGANNFGDIAWANEFVFTNGTALQLYKYNVNTNAWATMAPRPFNAISRGQGLTWDYNDAGYLYWLNTINQTIYIYDIAGDAWSAFATYPSALTAWSSLVYVPRIRFLYLNSSGNVVANPMNLGAEFSGVTGEGVLYYVKALEAVGATTLTIEVDGRTDADSLMDVAPDVAGVPGAWGASVNLGAIAANGTVPFWIRIDASGAPTTQPRCGRLTLTT